jgi:uncharacterized membrane protein
MSRGLISVLASSAAGGRLAYLPSSGKSATLRQKRFLDADQKPNEKQGLSADMANLATSDAPRRTLTMDAPWRWLGAGFRDMFRAPHLSIGYGVLVIGGGAGIIYLLWTAGYASLIPVAFGCFAIFGPLLAVGLYEMSRRIEADEAPRLFPVKFAGPRSPMQLAYIGFFLMFAALVWARMAMLLYALFTNGNYMPLDQFLSFAISTGPGLGMVAVGTIIGGGIAFAIYLLTVVSVPMLMNERTDFFTAIGVGLKAVNQNFGAMLLWAWLIAVITAAGVATFFVGLAIAFPLLGHASWHAYRDIRGS